MSRPRYSRSASVPTNLGRDSLEVNKLRFSSLGLYGRDPEKTQLRGAYDRVRKRRETSSRPLERCRSNIMPNEVRDDDARASSPELVLLSGRPGTGKSALAHSLGSIVRQTKNLFASGKFDSRKQSEPYTAFVSVFNQLCEIVVHTENHSQDMKERSSALAIQSAICDGIGSEGALLAEIVPKLSLILDEQQIASQDNMPADTDYEKTKNKFNFLLRRFVHAFCKEKTVVMFLDDLQWADEASLELLKTLVSDRDNPDLLIIGSYRDNEVRNQNHPLSMYLGDIDNSNNTAISTIQIGNLSKESVNELIANLLNSTLDITQGLATIIHKKTYGNAFSIVHFLKNMQDEGILWFCIGTLSWKWDEDEIQSNMSVADNVADILLCKIKKKLSEETRKVLQVAACLGGTFDSSKLLFVMNKIYGTEQITDSKTKHTGSKVGNGSQSYEIPSVIECLNICAEEGLIESDDGLQYRFAHDQILSSAFSLIPKAASASLQFQIGQAFLESMSDVEVKKNLFVIVNLLNKGVELAFKDNEKRIQLLRLNLLAGKKAMKTSAFGPAITYLKVGIYLMTEDSWQKETALSLDLFNTLAKAQCCNGNLEEMDNCLTEILGQNLPIEDKARVYKTKAYSMYFLQSKPVDAVDISLNTLSQLGVKFPKKNIKIAQVKEIVKTKYMLRGLCISDLSDHFTMEEENRLSAMQMMETLLLMAFHTNPALFVVVVLKMVQWSFCYGVSKYSSMAFACYGILLCGVMGDIEAGNDSARVALALLERFKAKDMESMVLFACNFSSHWVEPGHLTHKHLLQAYEVGMQTGDINWAMLSLRNSNQMAVLVGKPLAFIDKECQSCFELLNEYKQDGVTNLLLPTWQFVLNLMGESDDPKVLSGSVMNQEDLLKRCREGQNKTLENIIIFHQLWSTFYFQDFNLAGTLVKNIQGINKTNRSSPLIWRCALVEGLTAFTLARRNKSRKWKAHAIKTTAKVRKWVKKGIINCNHVLLMLEAELAVLNGDKETAKKKYDAAITVTARSGFIHDRALANERAGDYMLEIGDKYFAAHYLGFALQLWSRWGAKAKSEHLLNKHLHLLSEHQKSVLDDTERRWSWN